MVGTARKERTKKILCFIATRLQEERKDGNGDKRYYSAIIILGSVQQRRQEIEAVVVSMLDVKRFPMIAIRYCTTTTDPSFLLLFLEYRMLVWDVSHELCCARLQRLIESIDRSSDELGFAAAAAAFCPCKSVSFVRQCCTRQGKRKKEANERTNIRPIMIICQQKENRPSLIYLGF